jgi:hypothetical protein
MSEDFDPRFDPAFQRGYDGPMTFPERTRAGEGPVAEQHAGEPARTREQTEPIDEPTPGVNPFLVVLGALAVVLIGVGLYLVSRMGDLYADASSEFDFVAVQALLALAPLLIALGAATGIGLLFVLAMRWRASGSPGARRS